DRQREYYPRCGPHQLHVSPQIVPTSATHVESQLRAQQNESELQICFTQGSHDDTSLPPVEHRSCEQVVVVLVTVHETVEVSTSPPRVPLTPMLYVPGAAVPGDSVSVVDEFAASRLAAKLACAPCGTPVAASVALPENPVFAVSAMV